MLSEVRLAPPFRALHALLPPSPCSPSSYYIKSGSRQSDRLPPEMTPVTEGCAANLQASFCLNSLSPHCQILIFSVTASVPPLRPFSIAPATIPPPQTTPPSFIAHATGTLTNIALCRCSRPPARHTRTPINPPRIINAHTCVLHASGWISILADVFLHMPGSVLMGSGLSCHSQ